MYLLCLDESGIYNLKQKKVHEDSNFFVLAGVIIAEKDFHKIKESFCSLKNEILPVDLQTIPIHAVELHNLKYNKKSIYNKFFTPEQARDILLKFYNFLKDLPIEAIAIIIDNYELCNKYISPDNPYLLAYKFMVEKFQKIIEKRNDCNSLGIINISQSHQNITKRIEEVHKQIMFEGTKYVQEYRNLLPRVNILPTKEFPFFEIADLICYAFSRSYRGWLCKHLKKKDLEGSDYLEIIRPICTTKIGRISIGGKINIKVFPFPRFLENQQKDNVHHQPSA